MKIYQMHKDDRFLEFWFPLGSRQAPAFSSLSSLHLNWWGQTFILACLILWHQTRSAGCINDAYAQTLYIFKEKITLEHALTLFDSVCDRVKWKWGCYILSPANAIQRWIYQLLFLFFLFYIIVNTNSLFTFLIIKRKMQEENVRVLVLLFYILNSLMSVMIDDDDVMITVESTCNKFMTMWGLKITRASLMVLCKDNIVHLSQKQNFNIQYNSRKEKKSRHTKIGFFKSTECKLSFVLKKSVNTDRTGWGPEWALKYIFL